MINIASDVMVLFIYQLLTMVEWVIVEVCCLFLRCMIDMQAQYLIMYVILLLI